MPCDSSYMDATPRERLAAKRLSSEVTAYADNLVYALDVMRSYLLGEIDKIKYITTHRVIHVDMFENLQKKNASLYYMVRLPGSRFDAVQELLIDYNELADLIDRKSKVTPEKWDYIKFRQNEHREHDLRRLMKSFAESGDRERLAKVIAADNTKPLEPQLGFDPDGF